jgi:hypothetical protein
MIRPMQARGKKRIQSFIGRNSRRETFGDLDVDGREILE